MKLHLSCPQCFQEQSPFLFCGSFQEQTIEQRLFAMKEWVELHGFPTSDYCAVDIRDDGIYEITCIKGHKTVTLLQQLLFEILFDVGAYAITDGYYREAVSSFTASLERFYEFFIKVICSKNGVSDDVFKKTWALVSKQSERQLGAYIFFYSMENNSPPNLPDSAFRNSVIHKGVIPSKEAAIKYGNEILNLINPVLYALKKKYPEHVQRVVSQHFSEMREKRPTDRQESLHCETTIISVSTTPHVEEFRTLEDEIQSIEIRKKQYLTCLNHHPLG